MEIELPNCSSATFPSGLYQPAGSFRFSVDALLLGSFVKQHKARYVADLGAGCGIVGLTYLLGSPSALCVGIECQEELVASALVNAKKLGYQQRYTCLHGHVEDICVDKAGFFRRAVQKTAGVINGRMVEITPPGGNYDVVLANPPYRIQGSGRLPSSSSRCKALFGNKDTLAYFCAAAYALLAPDGVFGIVFPAGDVKNLVDIINHAHLYVYRTIIVYGRQGKEPVLALLEAGKTAPEQCQYESPLFLHDAANVLTESAVSFCPCLAR